MSGQSIAWPMAHLVPMEPLIHRVANLAAPLLQMVGLAVTVGLASVLSSGLMAMIRMSWAMEGPGAPPLHPCSAGQMTHRCPPAEPAELAEPAGVHCPSMNKPRPAVRVVWVAWEMPSHLTQMPLP